MQTITCEIDIITQQDLPLSQAITVSAAVGNIMQEVGIVRLENNTVTVTVSDVLKNNTVTVTVSDVRSGTSGTNLELLFLLIPAIAIFLLEWSS